MHVQLLSVVLGLCLEGPGQCSCSERSADVSLLKFNGDTSGAEDTAFLTSPSSPRLADGDFWGKRGGFIMGLFLDDLFVNSLGLFCSMHPPGKPCY